MLMKRKDYIIRRTLDFLTFRPCIFCGRGVAFEEHINVCPYCSHLIHKFGASGTVGGYALTSVLPYIGNVRYAMQRFKFNNKKYLGYTFATIALNRLKEFPWLDEIDCIACVPMGKRNRMYNQCAVMASHIAEELNLPFDESALAKIKDNPPFYTLSREERMRKIKDSFGVAKPEFFRDRKVLLIDDIFTTGATMMECAFTVERGGASDVYCLAICYGDDV